MVAGFCLPDFLAAQVSFTSLRDASRLGASNEKTCRLNCGLAPETP